MKTQVKLTKAKMREVINEIKNADEVFLMGDCGGLDLMIDAVNNSLDKMTKEELKKLYEKAIKSDSYEDLCENASEEGSPYDLEMAGRTDD